MRCAAAWTSSLVLGCALYGGTIVIGRSRLQLLVGRMHLGRPTNKNKQKVKELDDKIMEVESNAAVRNMQTQRKPLTGWAYEAWQVGDH
jgi:hypothetical protein